MKQLLSHYQAVHKLKYPVFGLDVAIDLDELIKILADEYENNSKEKVAELNDKYFYLIIDKDEIEYMEEHISFVLRFTDENDLLPTANMNQVGCVISSRGKEYVIFYDDEGRLSIGHNGILRCFSESESWVNDINEIYWFIFEDLIPEIEE